MDLFMHANLLDFGIKIAAAAAELVVGFIVGPWVRKMINRIDNKKVDRGLITFVGSLSNISIKVLAIIIALSQLGVNLNVIVGLFSALGLGISLALQNNMANLASGIQILLTRPFKVGDLITVENYDGNVQRIELMFTTIETFNKQLVAIPNSDLVNNPVVNYTDLGLRRSVINVDLPINYEPSEFKERLLQLANTHELCLKDPVPAVYTSALNQQSVTISLYAYSKVEDYWTLFCDLNQQAIELRLEMGIGEPYKTVKIANFKETETSSLLEK